MIEAACPDDCDLLALVAGEPGDDALAAHVAACPACRDRVAHLDGELSTLRLLGAEGLDTQREVAHPAFLGKYFLAGVARQDDLVVSYRGVHSLVSQDVLIHLRLARTVADPVARGLFLAACRPLVRLNDPRVARIFDADVHDERPYLVAEDIRGPGLEAYLAGRPAAPDVLARLAAELARGLEAAHRQGLAHGRLTALDVVVDPAGSCRLTGFGVARLLGFPGEDRGNAGDDLVALGTLLLGLAPEGPLARVAARAASAGYDDAGALARDLERLARPARPAAWPWILAAAALVVAAAILLASFLRHGGAPHGS